MKKTNSALNKFSLTADSRDLPASQGMLDLVRTELKEDISTLRSDMNAGFSGLDSEIQGTHSKIHGLQSEIHGMRSDVTKVAILMEQSNSKMDLVLEGFVGQTQRQDRLETRMDSFERLILSLARTRD